MHEPRANLVETTWLLLLLLAMINPASAASTNVKTYILEQKNAVLSHVKVYVCPTALKVEFKDNNAYLVAKAPDWRVVIFSPSMKTGMDMSYSQYLAHPPHFTYVPSVGGSIDDTWPTFRTSPTKLFGFDAARFVVPYSRSTYKFSEKMPTVGYYMILENKAIPAQPCKILAKLFFQHTLPGIPLGDRMNVENTPRNNSIFDFRGTTILETTAIAEKAISPEFFTYPKTFKKVAHEIDVISDDTRRKQFEDLSKDMRVGE